MPMAKTSYNVPEEIWYEILQRLPSKSLSRFRSVCMSWCRLITSQEFIYSHLNQNLNAGIITNMLLKVYRKNPGGYYGHENWKKDFVFYSHDRTNKLGICKFFGVPSFLPEPYAEGCKMDYKILGSCNGLICLMADSDIVLWNPCIEKYFRVTRFGIDRSCDVFGFGVNLLDGDFKVVRVAMLGKTFSVVEVFSLETRRWKMVKFEVDSNNTTFDYVLSERQAYMKGRSHWIHKSVKDSPILLVSFDMSDEVFREISVPEQLARMIRSDTLNDKAKLVTMSLKECCLGIAIEGTGRIDIWLMTEYGVLESWSNLYTIDMGLMKSLRFFGFMKNGSILVSGKEQGSRKEDQLMIHDPHSKLTFKLGISSSQLYGDKYVESLVLLEHDAISEYQDAISDYEED